MDKLRHFNNSIIKKFDNFSNDKISNRVMSKISESLKLKGINVLSVEEPIYDNDGMFEISSNVSINVKRCGIMTGSVKLQNDEFVFTNESDDLSIILRDLNNLQLKHNINEDSDYTTPFKTTSPQPPTPHSAKMRAENIKECLSIFEEGLDLLKKTPKLDWMDDIPNVIGKIEEILGSVEDSSGLRGLYDIYKKNN